MNLKQLSHLTQIWTETYLFQFTGLIFLYYTA